MAVDTWPVVFEIGLEEPGSYYLWVLADADDDEVVSAGDAWGLCYENPVVVKGHEQGVLVVFDNHWPL